MTASTTKRRRHPTPRSIPLYTKIWRVQVMVLREGGHEAWETDHEWRTYSDAYAVADAHVRDGRRARLIDETDEPGTPLGEAPTVDQLQLFERPAGGGET